MAQLSMHRNKATGAGVLVLWEIYWQHPHEVHARIAELRDKMAGGHLSWGFASSGVEVKRRGSQDVEGEASVWDFRRSAKTSGSTPLP